MEDTFMQIPDSLSRTRLFFNKSIVITDQKSTVHSAFSQNFTLALMTIHRRRKAPGYRWAALTWEG